MTFSLKPVFVGWSTLVAQFPIHLFLTFWSGGVLGGLFGAFVEKYITLPVSSFVFFGGLTFVCLPVCVYFSKKLNYNKTEYNFFEDRLEFEEGFFTINKKVIKYQDIKEVTLRRGVLQRVNDLGTIYLGTLATGSSPYLYPFSTLGFGNTSASGISVKDIAGPEKEFERIRKIIESSK